MRETAGALAQYRFVLGSEMKSHYASLDRDVLPAQLQTLIPADRGVAPVVACVWNGDRR